MFQPHRAITAPDEGYTPPVPELGKSVLRLEVRPRVEYDRNGKPRAGQPRRRWSGRSWRWTARRCSLPPGTLVRVSGWMKVPTRNHRLGGRRAVLRRRGRRAAGRARLEAAKHWKQFHLYRRVPASGQISVTLALTGVGVAYFDDIRIEPLVPGETAAATGYQSVFPASGAPKR